MITQQVVFFSFSCYSVSAMAGHLVVFFSVKTKVLIKADQKIQSMFWKKKKKHNRFLCVRLTAENFLVVAKKKPIYERHGA